VPVVVTPVSSRTFEERVIVQGNLEAETYATVAARVDGTVETIFVDEGDTVVAGETKLFQVDALKLQKAVDIRRQDREVARCACREKEANLERVEAELEKARIDYERYQHLYERSSVPRDRVEQYESLYKQAQAQRKHAVSLVDLAAEQEHQAEAAVAMAEKDLSDALVYAPISGKVSRRFVEEGENVGVGAPVIRIEDTSIVELSAFLPAQYYPRVVPGNTPVRVRVYGMDAGTNLVVSYKSPTIDPTLRTFEIKCVLTDPAEGVVPGAMADVEVLLAQREGLGVPTDAVQERKERSVVFVIQDGSAHMVEVETGIETDGWTELSGGPIEKGAPVVTMGQYMVEEGTAVTVRKEES
jgi:RND family efflux transporter MFP subunit